MEDEVEAKVKDAMTLDEMRKLLEVDRVERAKRASQEIQQVLEKYNCVMHATIEFGTQGQMFLQYKVIPK